MTQFLNVAIVQAAPIPLCIDRGIEQTVSLCREAIDQGAKLIGFGETFLGGYPIWLDEAPGAALWDHPGSKALHRILMDQAIVENDPRLAPLQELVDTSQICISLGAHERLRSSLYNNQMLFRPNLPVLNHRKLVPTHGERLIWNRGDGSTINVHQADWGRVGNLICWEHWMPLARAAMHNLQEDVHIAAWPTARETYQIASRHYAFEGGCHVLAAGTLLHRQDLLDGLQQVGGHAEAEALFHEIPDAQLQFGQSMIIAPDATILAAAEDREMILSAKINLDAGKEAKAALDVDGHYSRADVFDLTVDTRKKAGVNWSDT
ncbi:MAG: carbon-nitrogen hydrolase family protein [Parasphingorhabdus sp.]|uniref:carbon-nitrogen hydrolase family protein n=1 Tax=Parasphingorhabdus sp. TaxID=2709688 RepID=UPI003297A3A9